MEKIVQTAGRDALGEFAPDFAHFNDDILFGEEKNDFLKTRKQRQKMRRQNLKPPLLIEEHKIFIRGILKNN